MELRLARPLLDLRAQAGAEEGVHGGDEGSRARSSSLLASCRSRATAVAGGSSRVRSWRWGMCLCAGASVLGAQGRGVDAFG